MTTVQAILLTVNIVVWGVFFLSLISHGKWWRNLWKRECTVTDNDWWYHSEIDEVGRLLLAKHEEWKSIGDDYKTFVLP